MGAFTGSIVRSASTATPFTTAARSQAWALRRNRDAHVHVVRHQVSLHDLAFLLFRQRMENRAQLTADAPENGFTPPFGHEHYVILATWAGFYTRKDSWMGRTFSSLTGQPVAYQFQLILGSANAILVTMGACILKPERLDALRPRPAQAIPRYASRQVMRNED